MYQKLVSALFLVMLVGCTALGFTEPQSFDQKLAYSYSTVTAVRSTAADMVIAKTIKPEDGKRVLELTDQARLLLDSSKAAGISGDQSTAVSNLALANQILVELQKYLVAHKK